jgi:hypothetical protein
MKKATLFILIALLMGVICTAGCIVNQNKPQNPSANIEKTYINGTINDVRYFPFDSTSTECCQIIMKDGSWFIVQLQRGPNGFELYEAYWIRGASITKAKINHTVSFVVEQRQITDIIEITSPSTATV